MKNNKSPEQARTKFYPAGTKQPIPNCNARLIYPDNQTQDKEKTPQEAKIEEAELEKQIETTQNIIRKARADLMEISIFSDPEKFQKAASNINQLLINLNSLKSQRPPLSEKLRIKPGDIHIKRIQQ